MKKLKPQLIHKANGCLMNILILRRSIVTSILLLMISLVTDAQVVNLHSNYMEYGYLKSKNETTEYIHTKLIIAKIENSIDWYSVKYIFQKKQYEVIVQYINSENGANYYERISPDEKIIVLIDRLRVSIVRGNFENPTMYTYYIQQ
jgi:hypothetical protein